MGLISRVSSRTYRDSIKMSLLLRSYSSKMLKLPIQLYSTTAFIFRKKQQTRIPTKTASTKNNNIGLTTYLKLNTTPEKRDEWLSTQNITDSSQIDHLYRLHLSKIYKNLSEKDQKEYFSKGLKMTDDITEKYVNSGDEIGAKGGRTTRQPWIEDFSYDERKKLEDLADEDKKLLGIDSVVKNKTFRQMLHDNIKKQAEGDLDGSSELDSLRMTK